MPQRLNDTIIVKRPNISNPWSLSKRARNKARKRGDIIDGGVKTKSTPQTRTALRKKIEKETGVYHAWHENVLKSLGTRIDSTPYRPKYVPPSKGSNPSGRIHSYQYHARYTGG